MYVDYSRGGRQEYDDKTNKLISDTNASRPSGNPAPTTNSGSPTQPPVTVPGSSIIDFLKDCYDRGIDGIPEAGEKYLAARQQKAILAVALSDGDIDLVNNLIDLGVITVAKEVWPDDIYEAQKLAILGEFISAAGKVIQASLAISQLLREVDLAAAKGIKTAEDILRPGGKLLGEAGTSSKIRILQGSADDAAKLFDDLAAGGKPITGTSYPGRMVELPGGGVVKIRPSGTSGNFPTIDVDIPGIGIREIKFKP